MNILSKYRCQPAPRLHRAKKTKASSFKVHQTCTGPKNPKNTKTSERLSLTYVRIYTQDPEYGHDFSHIPKTKPLYEDLVMLFVSTCHSSATTMMSQFDMCHSSPSTDTRSLAKTHSAQPCTNDHPLLESPMQWGGCGCVGIAFIRPWLLLRESKSLHMTLCKWGGGRCNDKFVLESQSLASSSTQFTHIHIVQEGFNSVSHAWPRAPHGPLWRGACMSLIVFALRLNPRKMMVIWKTTLTIWPKEVAKTVP